ISADTMSRFTVLQSDTAIALAPDPDSILWRPARAILGDAGALAGVLLAGLALLGGTILIFSRRFGEHTLAATASSAAHATDARATNAQATRATAPYAFR